MFGAISMKAGHQSVNVNSSQARPGPLGLCTVIQVDANVTATDATIALDADRAQDEIANKNNQLTGRQTGSDPH